MSEQKPPAGQTRSVQSLKGAFSGWMRLKLVLLSLVLLSPLLIRSWNLWRTPNIGPPFDVEEFLRSDSAATDNAFDHYRRAYASLEQVSLAKEVRLNEQDVEAVYRQGWNAASDKLKTWFEDRRKSLSEWKRGTECSETLYHSLNTSDVSTAIPVTESLLTFARLAVIESLRLEAEGDLEQTEDWHLAILRCSNHVSRRGGIKQCQIAIGLYSLFFNGILRWAEKPQVTPDQLRHVLSEHQQFLKSIEPMSTVIKSEYIYATNTLKRQDWVKNSGLGWGVQPNSAADWGMKGYYWTSGEPAITWRILDLVLANQLEEIDKTLPLQQPHFPSINTLLYNPAPAQTPKPNQVSPMMIDRIVKGSAVARHFLTPRLNFLDTAFRSSRVKHAIIDAVLAAQIYARERGEFPEELASLSPNDLVSGMRDPMDKNNQQLRYRRASNNKGIIYSVGYNGTDEGGHIRRESGNYADSVDANAGTKDLGVHFRIR